jgi:hypothetical protein
MQIPCNTQAINDYQEHTLQSSKEIADSYLESQKEIIKSFQSTWVPYINMYDAFWNNWALPQRAAENLCENSKQLCRQRDGHI